MATKTWGAGSAQGIDGQWDNPLNWDADTLPVDGDDVIGDSANFPNFLTAWNSVLLNLNSIDTSFFPIQTGIGDCVNINIQAGGHIFFSLQGINPPILFTGSLPEVTNNPTYSKSFVHYLETVSSVVVAQGATLECTYVTSVVPSILLKKDATFIASAVCRTLVDFDPSVLQYNIVKNRPIDFSLPNSRRVNQSQSFTTNGTDFIFNRIVVPSNTAKFDIYLADINGHPTGASLYSKTFEYKSFNRNRLKEVWLDVGNEITLAPSTQYCAVFGINLNAFTENYDFVNQSGYSENIGAGEVWSYFENGTWTDISSTERKAFALSFLEDIFVFGKYCNFNQVYCSKFSDNFAPSGMYDPYILVTPVASEIIAYKSAENLSQSYTDDPTNFISPSYVGVKAIHTPLFKGAYGYQARVPIGYVPESNLLAYISIHLRGAYFGDIGQSLTFDDSYIATEIFIDPSLDHDVTYVTSTKNIFVKQLSTQYEFSGMVAAFFSRLVSSIAPVYNPTALNQNAPGFGCQFISHDGYSFKGCVANSPDNSFIGFGSFPNSTLGYLAGETLVDKKYSLGAS